MLLTLSHFQHSLLACSVPHSCGFTEHNNLSIQVLVLDMNVVCRWALMLIFILLRLCVCVCVILPSCSSIIQWVVLTTCHLPEVSGPPSHTWLWMQMESGVLGHMFPLKSKLTYVHILYVHVLISALYLRYVCVCVYSCELQWSGKFV